MAKKRPAPAESASGSSLPASQLELGRIELLASIFGAGAAVMVIEILGTRIIGPVFGVNLFIWAALLTVTLTALAAGYYSGGVLVDRRPNARLLNLIIVAVGALLGLVPAIRHAVLGASIDFGPQ